MPADFLFKVAAALDEAARVLDAHEAEKIAAVKEARAAALKVVSERYVDMTGEELPDDIFKKLAASEDGDLISTVQKLVEKTASHQSVESLGRSSDRQASTVPLTKQERADAAWERLGNWAIS